MVVDTVVGTPVPSRESTVTALEPAVPSLGDSIAAPQPTVPAEGGSAPASTPAVPAATSPLAPSALPATSEIAADLRSAFLLGWTMAELSGRLQKAALEREITTLAKDSPSDGADDCPIDWLRVTGAWRVSFQRLARLHQARFPDSTTDDARFDAQRLPAYLREGSAYDRGDIGLGNGADGKPPLEKFGVYDATRRAMNCLALLFTPPSAYLLPASQDALVTTVLQDTAASPPDGQSAVEATVSAEARLGAVKKLTERSVGLLEVWSAYLYESLSVSDCARQGTECLPEHYGILLTAYDAGHALASISWKITLATYDAEIARLRGTDDDEICDTLTRKWSEQFGARRVQRLQRQLSVLGYAFDRDDGHQDLADQRDGLFSRRRLTLPSEAVRAVMQGLTYWQRSYSWLTDSSSPGRRPSLTGWAQLEETLVQQIAIWQGLVLGREPLRAYAAETRLLELLGGITRQFATTVVQEGIQGAGDVVRQQLDAVVDATAQETQKTLDRLGVVARDHLAGLSKPIKYVCLGAGFSLLAGVALLIGFGISGWPIVPLVGAFIGSVGSAVGAWRAWSGQKQGIQAVDATHQQASNAIFEAVKQIVPDMAQRVQKSGFYGRLAAQVEMAVEDAKRGFKDGLEVMHLDLQYLCYTVGVSWPLVEYFVRASETKEMEEIHEGFDFVKTVIWTDEELRFETMRVAYSAFGPSGFFALFQAAAPAAVAAPQTVQR
jgi:hypothetical protein